MTKYILQSGNIKVFPEKLKKFNEEIFKDFSDKIVTGGGGIEPDGKIKVLLCFFAMPREDWEERYEIYKKNIGKGVNIEIETEMAMPDKFTEQCQRADVVSLSGGDDTLLKCWLDRFDIPKIWEGKVVVTNSASSNYLAESFWTCDWRKNMKGSGIVPIRFIPHYKSPTYGKDDSRGPIDWDKALKELENFGDKNLPIHALEEGDFVVIEK